MLIVYETHEQLLEENSIIDKILEKKDQLLAFWKKKKESLPDKLKEIEKKLIDAGFDVEKIKKDAKSAAGKSKIKNGRIDNFKSSLNNFVNSFKQKKYLTGNPNTEEEDTSLFSQTLISLIILALVLFINTYAFTLLTPVFGPTLAKTITSILVCPIVEETGKMLSVKHNATGMYFVLFNLVEFYIYILSPLKAGESIISKIVSTGIPPIIMHALTTMIHVENKNSPVSGLTLSTFIHVLWNTLAKLNN